MVGHPRHQPCRPALLSCFLRAYCHAVVAVVSGMGIVCFVFRIHSVIRPVGNHRRTKGRKGGCSACHAVRILCWTLATVRHGTRLVLRWHIIRVWCPHSVCLSCGNCRRLDIMGVGQQDTIHIPPRQEMQGVYGSAVVGSGGQHTEPVEAVNELPDGLAVAAHVLCQFHIGSCCLSHLQLNLNSLDLSARLRSSACAGTSVCRWRLCRLKGNPTARRKGWCSNVWSVRSCT